MECLLPTEIARLVYGYLMEEGCTEAAQVFMKTSQHMKECLMYAAKGRRFNTRVLGLNLVNLLDLLADVTCFVKTVECEAQSITRDELLNKLKVTLKLDAQEPSANKPVYLRFTVPSESKHTRKNKSSLDSSPSASKTNSDVTSLESRLSSPDIPNVSAERRFQVLLENKALHEKLAENINRVVANKSDTADSLEKVLEKKIVETIVNTTEQDPFFEEMLEELVGSTMMDIEKSGNNKPEENELENDENKCADPAPRLAGDGNHHHGATGTILERALVDSGVTSPKFSPPKPSPITPTSDLLVLHRMPHFPVSVPQLVPGTALSMPFISSPSFPPSQKTSSCVPPSQPLRVSSSPGPIIFNCATPSSSSSLRINTAPKLEITRGRKLLPKQPDQSSIRILSNTPHQALNGSSVVGVLPKPPYQGEPSIYINEKSALPQPSPSLIRVFPHSDSVGFRVGGVRTRGGKQPLKSYGRRKQIVPSKQKEEQEPGQNQQENRNPSALAHVLSPGPVTDSPAGNVVATISVAVSSCGQKSIVTTKTASVVQCSPGVSGPVESNPGVVAGSWVEENPTAGDCSSTLPVSTPTPQNEPAHAIAQPAPEAAVPSDVTPQQGSEPRVKLRKRLSLSTPRKASHVRTLEFKTPPKGTGRPQRSLTSPKDKGSGRRTEINKMIESVKKASLFKSPDKLKEPDLPKEKKEKKAWDADLRCYTGEEEFLSSVQLKRVDPLSQKNTDELKQSSSNVADSLGKAETNEDLVSQIQRDVLDVIGEEGLTDISSNSPGGSKSCDSEYSPPKSSKSPIRSPGTPSILEIGDIGLPPSAIKRLYNRTPTRDESSCTIDSPLSKAPKVNLFLSPSKAVSGPFNSPNKTGVSPAKSASLTPNSMSLEATLIKECSRIESEGMERAREEAEARPGEQHGVMRPVTEVSSSSLSLLPPKGVVVLKTPAKTELPIPDEMTPLSKIINEETRLANVPLLTPTIPPTPDHDETKNRSPEDVESPCEPSASQQPLNVSSPEVPPACRKSPKTPSKTPVIRLKNVKTGSPKKRKKREGKKKSVGAETPISPSQLIAECLQNVKEAVYGSSKSKSRAKTKSIRGGEKGKPPEETLPKQKPVQRKKSTRTGISNLEFIESFERRVGALPITSSEDEELGNGLREERTAAASGSKLRPKMTDRAKLEKELPLPEINFNKKELGGQAVSPSPEEGPLAGGGVQGQTLSEIVAADVRPLRDTVDLNSFCYSFVVNQTSHCLRPSPFLSLLELPRPVVESAVARRAATSSKVESSRRKRKSQSESSDEEPAKRRRIDEDRRRYPGPPYHGRGRGRSRGRGRGAFRMELSPRMISARRGRVSKKDFDRWRRDKRSVSLSDEDNRRRRSRASSRDGSRSRTRPEIDDRRSPDRSRSKNRPREPSSSARKPERSKTSRPSSTERKFAASPPQSRKSSAASSPPPRKLSRVDDLEEGELSDASLTTVFSLGVDSEVLDFLENMPLQERLGLWFQMDGCPAHRSRVVTEWMDANFENRTKKPSHQVVDGVVGGRLSSPVADENRQALLQNVDLDHFLSIVHGEAK